MSNKPLFEGLDDLEREIAPDQLPAASAEAHRIAAEEAGQGNEVQHADERVIPVGGLIGPAGQGEHPGVVGGPGPVIPPVAPTVPVPLAPGDVPQSGNEPAELEQRAKDE